MSTKAQIQTSINTINDGGVNTAAEVRSVHNTELSNNYADTINETHSIGTITAQTGALNFYDVYFCKQGRKVSVKGVLANKQTSIDSSTSFFEIVDPEFFPNAAMMVGHKIYGHASNDNRPIRLHFSSNILRLNGTSLGVGQNVYVDFEYLTEN